MSSTASSAQSRKRKVWRRDGSIGDHTDYAEGFCLPMSLAHRTEVAMARPDAFRAASLANEEMRGFDPRGAPRGDWTDYIAGPIAELLKRGFDVPPVDVLVRSNVPQGAGVSSSAALEVAVIRAALPLIGAEMADDEIARAAQAAENIYCGVQCGILDQMACAICRPGETLLLDCRTNATHLVVVPPAFRFCGHSLWRRAAMSRRPFSTGWSQARWLPVRLARG